MSPLFANQSCDPFTARSSQCELGTYVQYAVNVHCAKDVAITLAYAQEKNIRLVIRNTGHDYNGKSTGAGAVAIWTHHLKEITVLDYETPRYTGKAMKMGAGVQAFEAYEAAHKQNLVIVGGECPTVGLAGGYVSTQVPISIGVLLIYNLAIVDTGWRTLCSCFKIWTWCRSSSGMGCRCGRRTAAHSVQGGELGSLLGSRRRRRWHIRRRALHDCQGASRWTDNWRQSDLF